MLPSLQLVQPTGVAEASQALAEFGDEARIYAGGAELLLLLRHGLLHSEVLIDVKKIARLRQFVVDGNMLHIGACVTHHALATSRLLREYAPSLAYAESQVANVRVRHQGTLGGNLCFNDPHSDPGTVLLVHEATVTVGGRRDDRRMPVERFLTDMYATDLAADELLLDIQVPSLPAGMNSRYLRLHRQQRPTLGVAVAVKTDSEVIGDIRIAVGCIGPQPRRLRQLEGKLKGSNVNDANRILAEQAQYLRALLRPVDDLLGSAEYKLYMARAFIGEALVQMTEVPVANA